MSDNKLTVGTLVRDKHYPEVGIVIAVAGCDWIEYQVYAPHHGKAIWLSKQYIEMECVVVKASNKKKHL
tara:strand:+ start:218 stop:424 length:207 start_codon:yes stop_codon:yes gene_type:complete